jgi:hypothetical protein
MTPRPASFTRAQAVLDRCRGARQLPPRAPRPRPCKHPARSASPCCSAVTARPSSASGRGSRRPASRHRTTTRESPPRPARRRRAGSATCAALPRKRPARRYWSGERAARRPPSLFARQGVRPSLRPFYPLRTGARARLVGKSVVEGELEPAEASGRWDLAPRDGLCRARLVKPMASSLSRSAGRSTHNARIE